MHWIGTWKGILGKTSDANADVKQGEKCECGKDIKCVRVSKVQVKFDICEDGVSVR